MSEPVKIAIEIRQGMITVLTAGVPVEFVTLDYDTAGGDPAELRTVPQDDGTEREAYVTMSDAESAGPFVMRAFEIVAGRGNDDSPAVENRPASDADEFMMPEDHRQTNYYECEECGTAWEDQWSCGCDDECPTCGVDVSPYESEDDPACACSHCERERAAAFDSDDNCPGCGEPIGQDHGEACEEAEEHN